MSDLLKQNAGQDRLIRELPIRIQELERANIHLVAAAQRPETPVLRGALVNANGSAFGVAGGAALIASYVQLGGPSAVDGVYAIRTLLRPSVPVRPLSAAPLPPVNDV
ncbi:MAG: hypothetical protein ACXIU8_02755 [Alkalilacustris sp.]